jgi:hypothetical protein
MKSVGKRNILDLECICEDTEMFSSLKVALCMYPLHTVLHSVISFLR